MSSDPPKLKGAPGWNDPPMFRYNSQIHSGSTGKLNLTKRVSFPLMSSSGGSPAQMPDALSSNRLPSDGVSSTSPPLASDLPPHVGAQLNVGPPMLTPPLSSGSILSNIPSYSLPSDQPINQLEASQTNLNVEITFQEMYDNLKPQIAEICKENEKTYGDIKKKINVLETMWNENKFNDQIKTKIFKLSEAIKEKNVNCGHELQRSLMVDHSSLCSSWIPALRHLLNSLESSHSLVQNNNALENS